MKELSEMLESGRLELLLSLTICIVLLGVLLGVLGQETVSLALMGIAFVIMFILAFFPLLEAILEELKEWRRQQ